MLLGCDGSLDPQCATHQLGAEGTGRFWGPWEGMGESTEGGAGRAAAQRVRAGVRALCTKGPSQKHVSLCSLQQCLQ